MWLSGYLGTYWADVWFGPHAYIPNAAADTKTPPADPSAESLDRIHRCNTNVTVVVIYGIGCHRLYRQPVTCAAPPPDRPPTPLVPKTNYVPATLSRARALFIVRPNKGLYSTYCTLFLSLLCLMPPLLPLTLTLPLPLPGFLIEHKYWVIPRRKKDNHANTGSFYIIKIAGINLPRPVPILKISERKSLMGLSWCRQLIHYSKIFINSLKNSLCLLLLSLNMFSSIYIFRFFFI